MELRRRLHTPFWRDPGHRPERGITKHLLAYLSVAAVLMVLFPPRHGYDEPISVQLALHEPAAWIGFAFMVASLGYFGKRVWAREHYAATIASGAMCLCLVTVAVTNPFSDSHLDAFTVLVLVMALLHWGLWKTHETLPLFVLASVATGAIGLCLFSLGYGERLLILASTASLNVVFYQHISY